jgi:predicted alpha/beta superfamily hydrolase
LPWGKMMRFSRHLLKIITIICFVTLLLIKTGLFAQISGKDIVIGKSIKMHSQIYDKDIDLNIYLPDDYAESNEKYPVLYSVLSYFKHNAVTVFDLSRSAIPGMIYVSVETYDSGDFIPTKIESRPSSGHADRFISFFKDELIPFIDSNYRTQPFRIFFSGSWGGIFCLYTLLTQPEVFNGYIAATPWFIYDGDKKFMLSNTKSFLKKQFFNQNFLFVAIDKDPEPGLRESFVSFTEILNRNPKKGLKIISKIWDEEDHYSIGHRAIYDGLKWIFKEWNEIPEHVLQEGMTAIKRYQKKLSGIFGYDIGINSMAIWNFCWKLMNDRKFKEAISMFKFCVELNPNEPYVYTGLGRAYEENGQLELAKENFEIAFNMAKEQSKADLPRYSDAIERIKKRIAEKK